MTVFDYQVLEVLFGQIDKLLHAKTAVFDIFQLLTEVL